MLLQAQQNNVLDSTCHENHPPTGNHEIEPFLHGPESQSGNIFTALNARWPTPQNPGVCPSSHNHAPDNEPAVVRKN